MRIALLNYNTLKSFDRNEKLNLLTLEYFLQNHETSIYNINNDYNIKYKALAEYDVLIITSKQPEAFDLLKNIRKTNQNIKTIYFSEYFELYLDKIIKYTDMSAYKFNLGSIIEYIENNFRNLENIKGVIYNRNNRIYINSSNNILPLFNIKQLNYSKYPDNTLYNESAFSDKTHPDGYKTGLLYFSKGCFFNCKFCINPFFYENVYSRNISSLKKDINYFKKIGIDHFSFEDTDILHTHNSINMLQEISKSNITFRAHARLDNITENNLFILKKAGCRRLDIGIENINYDILKKINKQINKDNIFKTIELCKKYDINPYILLITGLPYETEESLQENANFIENLKQKNIDYGLSIYRPMPGSELFNDLYSEIPENIISDGNHIHFKPDKLSKKDIADFYNRFSGKKASFDFNDIKNNYLKEFLKIDITNYFQGDFEPVPLNYWKGDKYFSGGYSHLVGRFSGFIKYRFNYKETEKVNLKISFRASSQTKNPGNITLKLNQYCKNIIIPPKSDRGELIEIIFSDLKISENNYITFDSRDGNGLSLFFKDLETENKYSFLELSILNK